MDAIVPTAVVTPSMTSVIITMLWEWAFHWPHCGWHTLESR